MAKATFLYSLIFLIITAIETTLYPTYYSLILTMGLIYKRWRVIAIEILIVIISFTFLHILEKEYLFIYTIRAISYINLYFIMSEYVDYNSILYLLGEKGVPLVVGFAYYPLFYRIASEISFNARARKIGFHINKLVLPFVVQMVKVAEDLYVSYTIKLYGKFNGKRNFKPTSVDIILISLSLLLVMINLATEMMMFT
ncbi:hypothetical protein [Sulfurisphaera ohwakuensis]|uniref:Energy-coupling factor transporter transmembrane protein EcfT n=2 Tax=Sulfurisphaera ohwakuensis TaxID=69656 RepID=A0A7J9RRH2_SULOH|nr:hypothetical protein [Sulfurisphaera ohwakuensis]MBB5253558.1 hypothetical protein [Sulfurisphaera ohwakuensis]